MAIWKISTNSDLTGSFTWPALPGLPPTITPSLATAVTLQQLGHRLDKRPYKNTYMVNHVLNKSKPFQGMP